MLKQIFGICIIMLFISIQISAQSTNNNGCTGIKQNVYTKITAPSVYIDRTVLNKTATSNFVVVESPSYPLPSQVRQALDYAVEIWSYLINTSSSTQQIKIFAEWKDLGNSTKLAQRGLKAEVWYRIEIKPQFGEALLMISGWARK